jgi:hypothetical protein
MPELPLPIVPLSFHHLVGITSSGKKILNQVSLAFSPCILFFFCTSSIAQLVSRFDIIIGSISLVITCACSTSWQQQTLLKSPQ